jgi:hypothetical protein
VLGIFAVLFGTLFCFHHKTPSFSMAFVIQNAIHNKQCKIMSLRYGFTNNGYFPPAYTSSRGQDSVVSIANGYGLDD